MPGMSSAITNPVRLFGVVSALVVMGRLPAAETGDRIDPIRTMQVEAERVDAAAWGHWGDVPGKYVSHSSHSNRLIPIYTFGITLEGVTGARSVYRDAAGLAGLYGRLPEDTLNPTADYCDQTDVHRLQQQAVDAGATRIVLVVFDGMDWTLTRTAAIAKAGTVAYSEGRGTGFTFQDYRGVETDFGYCVTSPANDGTTFDVDAQAVKNPGGEKPGGYDSRRGGATPWDPRANPTYLIGKDKERPHAFTDSAASATSLCTGRKTYNDAINVDAGGGGIETVAHRLQRVGWAVGVVTSVPIPHATPACAYARNVSRDDYQDISRDMLGERSISHRDMPLPGLDVVIGAGYGVRVAEDKDQGANFEAGNKYIADTTLAAVDADRGGRYRIAQRTSGRRGGDVLREAAEQAIVHRERLLGFFGTREGNLPFRTADGCYEPAAGRPPSDGDPDVDALRKKYGATIHYAPADLVENPSLAEMATVALDVLSQRGPFWLMVEAGDVDWASHANNIDSAIGAIESGDRAVRAIVEWIEAHGGWDRTVVIVTSDHGHMFVLDDPAAFVVPGR